MEQSSVMELQGLAAELQPFFYPESVAVIGASRNRYKPSGIPLHLFSMFGYRGELYPVNPKHEDVCGLKCYASVLEIPGKVDLAIISVPAAQTMKVLEECAAKGIKAAIIFSSGFAEVGEEGRQQQKKMQKIAQKTGMRILGPNCLGLLNYYNGNTASFLYQQKPEELVYPHTLSFITQSGGMGGIIYQMMLQYSVGFNYLVSTGNEADLSFAEILSYLAERDEVGLIGGFLEGLHKDGRLFMDACDRALRRRKLVTMLKVGRNPAAAAAASSHTGAMVGEDRVYDGLFKQYGVVRADEVEQMNALITIHAAGRIPEGKRIGVISVSGGGGVVVADKCFQFGLELASFSERTETALHAFFPSFGSVRNPVDLTSALLLQADLFERAISTVMADPAVDVGVIFYNLEVPSPAATAKIAAAYRQLPKPLVLFSWPSCLDLAVEAKKELIQAGVPVIENISSGLWAIAALADWKRKVELWQPFPCYTPGRRREAALQILRQYGAGRALPGAQAKKILQIYDIPVAREHLARSAEEAADAAAELGYPVVLKVNSPDILHKSDAGGVLLNLADEAAVREGFSQIMENAARYKPEAAIDGILVQEMLKPGLEVMIGFKQDPIFGPAVLFGLGGVFVEIFDDVAVRVAPLREQDAVAMLEEIRTRALLEGVRGMAPRDRDALVSILMKISRLSLELRSAIKEMDINPLIVYESGAGAVAADALIIPAGKRSQSPH
ncbi:MAG: acetate--CoA ligase family protein [Firmicutes bacterium]|nr:acetate--CoA ligase family protein [Bacillota bacterium]